MWMEVYKLDEEAYAVAKIQELSNMNLVDLVVKRNYLSSCYNHHFAMQHDLLRELAIHQSDLEPLEQRKRQVLEICANNVPDWWMDRSSQALVAACCLSPQMKTSHQVGAPCKLLKLRL